ncbi:MAG: superoxide dismutase family protein [Rhodovibrionaceae bacterium]
MAAQDLRATAALQSADGEEVGVAELTETPHGVLIEIRFDGLPQGTHAFHIHETGLCEPPFKSAGGHFNPEGAKHGMLAPEGKHAGDLPNIHMPEGSLRIEVLADGVTLAEGEAHSLFDDDGSAFVVHDGADDYSSDPAGAAGDRIACGLIEVKN